MCGISDHDRWVRFVALFVVWQRVEEQALRGDPLSVTKRIDLYCVEAVDIEAYNGCRGGRTVKRSATRVRQRRRRVPDVLLPRRSE